MKTKCQKTVTGQIKTVLIHHTDIMLINLKKQNHNDFSALQEIY